MKLKIFSFIATCAFACTSCNDVLDRPSQTTAEDPEYWVNETNVRLYANAFYPNFFPGYGVGYGQTAYTPNGQYNFNDDVVIKGSQPQFSRAVPSSKGSIELTLDWESQFTGPSWNFAWVRKACVMKDRIQQLMGDKLTGEQFRHWLGIARFFHALEYARLVNVFGDVPYYSHEVHRDQLSEIYKDRSPRNEVMDSVFADFRYALQNVKQDDGAQYVNRYVVAAFVSRWALFEGSWQKYHYQNNERAKLCFNLAVEAAQVVINSDRYAIATDFRSLFGSTDLTKAKDCILYRKYDAEQGVTHCVASYCNLNSPTDMGPNLDLIKAFICNDGKDWNSTTMTAAKDFTLDSLIATRDPRFEASFYHKPTENAKSCGLYVTKFIPRSALSYLNLTGGSPAPEFQGDKNVTGYPVMRYAEVLLNWIEAKAELATLGEAAVTQADIDRSINAIRKRPLDAEAIERHVKQTAPMKLDDLNNDPKRDADVSPLLWEIRRERRMEFAFEFSRVIDLRRWKKLNYMDTDANPDLLMGTWVNFPTELPKVLNDKTVGAYRVMNAAGKLVTYNGKNANLMKGFFYPKETIGRLPFLNLPNVNPYLSPIGYNDIKNYAKEGYHLSQTKGWPEGY
ncbi:RagB/SusD family nutrient uptake outer membrane protein [Hoylesella shahii]|uniref:RagB/SusD family nutrient uptake outer membrane protein n=1 Tax=Hoylesella shahii TaxID=228603 RepID=UPI0028EABA64|nr:RagB/SusD family nutrient uptake outer membrane protein [Hoylesella shahii]